jgi:spermidine/putrescine transport system ATP-binding protein
MKVELKKLQAQVGTTFIYITHDQSEALVMSDHVAVMNNGRFEQVDSPRNLYAHPKTRLSWPGSLGDNNAWQGDGCRSSAMTCVPLRPRTGRRSPLVPHRT